MLIPPKPRRGAAWRWCALAWMLVASSGLAQEDDLPELGDRANRYLSPAREKLIGQEFHRRLLTSTKYVDDYELRDYLQKLGTEISTKGDLDEGELSFNFINDSQVNAFAILGGYITLHTGLVMETVSESELASVLSHEIAHITQRHLLRLLARTSDNQAPALAAIIGSILIGGQAGLAGVAGTSAALTASQLHYTRDFEREADAIGIRLLAKTRFDPKAMAQFFGKLERLSRYDGDNVPEFLRTHPLSYDRVYAAEARAEQYPAVSASGPDDLPYQLVRARIRAHYNEPKEASQTFFEARLTSGTELEQDAARYGLGLIFLEQKRYKQARTHMAPLMKKYPEHAWLQALQAKIELASGNNGAALARIRTAIANNPDTLFLGFYLAEFELESGAAQAAKKTIRYQLRRQPKSRELYSLLARANGVLGQLSEAHQARAEYHALLGDFQNAAASLKLAMNEAKADKYLSASLDARLKEVEHLGELQLNIR